ncbi:MULTISPECIES: phosphatase PAP2 family protein [unclassified Pseudomonas]|uniref:phosphatase PAP2 family protein n=1 Tax=unclassified Pseudomonas TaxID=196821 RepID=UPI000876B7C2|nr:MULTISPECIES: phosphatase PAP2 family protein [unclassified Pseudomonas]SCZ33530.1 Membrane-associated enzyme, PAP2 (acid phosphatase) superfamily [Pseudomonas sp. NFACC44-2]SDA80156.1 Membrane-associated enzyme, PAP2 (acid phosphatase) superfamily [Pseudomonas sp. NFACC51]SEJ83829.1 Membrane-associated enzyme, PAP2 (acid phosphatase) superfamily [Pseudomonas sp. NFACC07-1]SFH68063.1 Membrane-associated enzyme, PAP2 (acid phosphatase) superfamily [Pseudomonas sp. NFACC54]SFT17757.1 Membrane
MLTSARARFYGFNLGIPLVCAVVVFLLFDMTHLDIAISDLFYDPLHQVFPLGHVRLFEQITHKWARVIPNWTGEAAIVGVLLSLFWPIFQPPKRPGLLRLLDKTRLSKPLRLAHKHRRDFLYVVFAFSLSTGVIHYLKGHTSVYCPVETTQYAGKIEHKEWFQNFELLKVAGDGRCWPGGHASGGFTMLALYFVARRYRWRHSKALMHGALALGFVYGTTRVLQGWHYMSHTFWAGIFVWLSCWLMALLFYGRAALEQPVLKPPRETQAAAVPASGNAHSSA